MSKYLISIVGPTCVGKTQLSINIAKNYKSEIISCDSRQFFKEMSIGTSIPHYNDLMKVKHNFIHNKTIKELYTVADYESEVISFLNEYYKKNDVCVMVGGSGLYENSIVNGICPLPKSNITIRNKLFNEYNKGGIEKLKNILKNIDNTSYNNIDLNNKHKIIRAIEVFLLTKKPIIDIINEYNENNFFYRLFKIIRIGLFMDKNILYNKINNRVEIMIHKGLIYEAKKLYYLRQYKSVNTIGYVELFDFFDKKMKLLDSIEKIKTNTRRYAKRQLTWFNRYKDVKWFNNYDYKNAFFDILCYIDNIIKN